MIDKREFDILPLSVENAIAPLLLAIPSPADVPLPTLGIQPVFRQLCLSAFGRVCTANAGRNFHWRLLLPRHGGIRLQGFRQIGLVAGQVDWLDDFSDIDLSEFFVNH
jgi:hypothetical protein